MVESIASSSSFSAPALAIMAMVNSSSSSSSSMLDCISLPPPPPPFIDKNIVSASSFSASATTVVAMASSSSSSAMDGNISSSSSAAATTATVMETAPSSCVSSSSLDGNVASSSSSSSSYSSSSASSYIDENVESSYLTDGNIPALAKDEAFSSYIKLIQHLIERCLILYMDEEECTDALASHAAIPPLLTITVWKELEKQNPHFFLSYLEERQERRCHGRSFKANNKDQTEADHCTCKCGMKTPIQLGRQ